MEAAIMDTAISTRIRHYGITDGRDKKGNPVTAQQRAKDDRYGYTLGRLLLGRVINQDQHDAGEKYAEDMARYLGLNGFQFPSAKAQNLFAIRSHVGEETEQMADRATRARDKMLVLRDLLLDCGDIDTGRRVEQAVKSVCLLDELRTINAPTRVWLVRGLNALRKHYGGGNV